MVDMCKLGSCNDNFVQFETKNGFENAGTVEIVGEEASFGQVKNCTSEFRNNWQKVMGFEFLLCIYLTRVQYAVSIRLKNKQNNGKKSARKNTMGPKLVEMSKDRI